MHPDGSFVDLRFSGLGDHPRNGLNEALHLDTIYQDDIGIVLCGF